MTIFTWKDMATAGCRTKGRSYKEDRWYGHMSSQQMGDQAYSKKGWLIFRKEGTKAFMKRLALCSDMVNSKDLPKAIWILTLSQIVRRVGKWKRKGSIFLSQWKGKEWVTHLHTGTQAAWDNRAKKGFEKAGLKWIKSMGDPCKARVSQLVL